MKKTFALITALLLLCPLWGCRRNDPPSVSAEESEPLSYAYTLCVTINPQLTLFMDAGDRVVGVRADNADAEADFAGVTLTGRSLTEALGVIVDTVAEKGRLKNGGRVEMTIDTAQVNGTDRDTVLTAAEQAVRARLAEKQLTAEVVTSAAAQPDASAGVTTGTAPTAAQTKPNASETEGTRTTGTTAKAPDVTTAPTTKKPAPATSATTKKPVTAADLNGSFAYQTVTENAESGEKNGCRYAVTFDTKSNTFRYAFQTGAPIEQFIEWGMYKTEKEALADKNATWNRIDGKYYGVQAGTGVSGKISKLTLDSVTVTGETGTELGTLTFTFDAEKGTLTCKDSTIEDTEELKGLVLTREN